MGVDDDALVEAMDEVLREEMTPEERDAYAAPGTLLRYALDAGQVPWPSRLVAQIEMATSDLLG